MDTILQFCNSIVIPCCIDFIKRKYLLVLLMMTSLSLGLVFKMTMKSYIMQTLKVQDRYKMAVIAQ